MTQPGMAEPYSPQSFLRITTDNLPTSLTRDVAEEVPIAIEVNGIGYAVLMASPSDLEDLAHGFLLADRLATTADEILSVDVHERDTGIVLRLSTAADVALKLVDRVRHRTSDSSCGLCGIENLDQAMRPLPPVTSHSAADDAAIFASLENLGNRQTLNQATGAVHAAALCDAHGNIRLIREDVGRHNAFDKLNGAMMRRGMGWEQGFALLSSRCSYELVEKAVLAGCPLLVTLSAGTKLAIDRAAGAGLDLRVLARPDAMLMPLGRAEVPYSAAVA